MTEYPTSILEPISFGKENKHYRFILKYDKNIRDFNDTPYGDPLMLDYSKILGYDNGKAYEIGEFI